MNGGGTTSVGGKSVKGGLLNGGEAAPAEGYRSCRCSSSLEVKFPETFMA